MILSLALFAIGVFCYAISQLQLQGKLKGGYAMWGEDSWHYKYVFDGYKLVEAPDTFYYRFFKIKYKERFPLSATALVWITDGYHLMQFFYIKLFILSIVLYSPVFGWWKDGCIYLGAWYLVFNLIYKVFSK